MTKVLRAGLLGIGMMGRHHARLLREIDGVDLVAVADSGGDPFGAAGNLRVLPDVDALIAAKIDMAIVAIPTKFHEEAAVKLAEAGIHTLVEKPISHTVDAGKRIVDTFEAKGIIGAVGQVERFNAALLELRRRLSAGELGDVYQIQTRRQGPYPARVSDVGVGKDLASHDIDLTAWVAQSPYRRVSAQTAYQSGREHEDMILITGSLQSGVIVNHVVNWLSPMKERVTMVTGEHGAFVADTLTGDLTFYENGTVPLDWASMAAFRGVSEGNQTRFALAKREPLRSELEAFRDAVLGRPNDLVTMGEGLQTLRTVEAAVLSASQQSWVDTL